MSQIPLRTVARAAARAAGRAARTAYAPVDTWRYYREISVVPVSPSRLGDQALRLMQSIEAANADRAPEYCRPRRTRPGRK